MKSSSYSTVLAMFLMLSGLGIALWTVGGYLHRYHPELFGVLPTPEPEVEVSETGQSSPGSYKIQRIVSSHLFGKAAEKPAPTTTQAPETKLRLSLLGVLASEDEHYARAMIRVSAKQSGIYSIGEQIESTDAKLHQVENERVIIDREGKLESLRLDRKKAIKRNGDKSADPSVQGATNISSSKAQGANNTGSVFSN